MADPDSQHESYILEQLQTGKSPSDILLEFIGGNDEDIDINSLRGKPENIIIESLMKSDIFYNLDISMDFYKKFLFYPSGLIRTNMIFANITKTFDANGKIIMLTTHPNINNVQGLGGRELIGVPGKNSPKGVEFNGVLYTNGKPYRLYMLLIENPMYIPVVRYAYSSGKGFIYGDRNDIKDTCGTYYWLEPDSKIFLHSNKTLVIPNRDVGLYVLTGADREIYKTLIDENYDYNGMNKEKDKDLFIDKIEAEYQRALKDIPPHNEYEDDKEFWPNLGRTPFTQKVGRDLDDELCRLARLSNIDVYVIVREDKHRYRYASEVIDTRSREISYNSLYKSK